MKLVEDDKPADEVEAYRMPLLEHLIELRNRLMWAGGAVVIGMCVSFAAIDPLLAWLTAPIDNALIATGAQGGLALVQTPFEGIYAYLRVAFMGGIVLSSPMLAWQVWGFIAPGLYKTERKVVAPLAISSVFLFLLGGSFAYYVIFPVAFPFFLNVVDIEASLSVTGYLSAVVRMMLAFGLCFQLPVGTWFLARMGLIDHKDMIGGFRYAMVGIFVVAAVITPPEALTQVMLAIPLCGLYGIGIIVAYFTSTKHRDEDGE